ncbi:hypothetical protein ACIGXM_31015 [Kitasatospora sp. NPDC052896]|uniref:hypothetical protein n=1 Tax=Kitasatospora sp. NPDC052896 TaxID=3364061 RepID=UPI0037C56164
MSHTRPTLVPDTTQLRQELDHRAEAELAVRTLVRALEVAGLPPLVGLEAFRITNTRHGAHVELGGCGARTLLAIAEYLLAHALCVARVIPGAAVPAGLAELSTVRMGLSR